jgi:hypothetical protein
MPYRAFITQVSEPPVASDSIVVTVEFRDAASSPPRSIMRTFKFLAGSTGAEMKAEIVAYRDRLRALDSVRAALALQVNDEVT